MKRFAQCFLRLMKLRYRWTLKNFPKLDPKHNYLILPNHISYLDPALLWSLLRPQRKLRPVATSRFAENRWLAPIFRLMGTIAVEELSEKKADTPQRVESINSALEALHSALTAGDSVLLYPSGQLAGQGSEYLGGKKSAYLAVQQLPEQTKILLVRTRGLRGSMWSNAWTGDSPSFAGGLVKGMWYFLANFLLFLPKRKLEFDFMEQTEELKLAAEQGLEHFNQTLEAFYNAKGEEKLNYVPHYFYYNDVKEKQLPAVVKHSLASLQQVKSYNPSDFPEELIETLKSELRRIKNLTTQDPIERETHLILDLYLDSLDMAELKNLILSRYPQASNTPILELKTLADLVAMAAGKSKSEASDFPPCERALPPELAKKTDWNLDPHLNILQLFKKQWKADKTATQSYDALF